MILMFIGISGSGKDTQADLLSQKFSFFNVSTGDLYRSISSGDSEMQQLIKRTLNDGFSNDMLTYGLLQVYLKYKYIEFQNIILNGVIRRYSQVGLLDSVLNDLNLNLDYVFNFVLKDKKIVIERLINRLYCPICKVNYNLKTNPPKIENVCDICKSELRRREDDNPESILKRINAFKSDCNEIIAEYKSRGILIDIDASQDIIEIHKEILRYLNL